MDFPFRTSWAAVSVAVPAVLAMALLASAPPAVARPGGTFLEAQRCRVNGTVDFGCFQQHLAQFEQFVLKDDAAWLPKSIVAEALVKYYDQAHVTSGPAEAVRAKAKVYAKAFDSLEASERGEVDDCKDEPSPDACLHARYCFKEAYIKVKNVLVLNNPQSFEAEIRWFEREMKGSC